MSARGSISPSTSEAPRFSGGSGRRLRRIPYGATRSYAASRARSARRGAPRGRPRMRVEPHGAHRAVSPRGALGRTLGGYRWGLARKGAAPRPGGVARGARRRGAPPATDSAALVLATPGAWIPRARASAWHGRMPEDAEPSTAPDYTLDRRVLILTLVALAIGGSRHRVADILVRLIGLFTNFFYYQPLSATHRWPGGNTN